MLFILHSDCYSTYFLLILLLHLGNLSTHFIYILVRCIVLCCLYVRRIAYPILVIFTHVTEINTVNSLIATAATGPAWPLSCRTNKHRDKSHMIAVPSRDPDTMTLYAGLDDKHVTASVCPYRHCFMESCRLAYSQTVTTYERVEEICNFIYINV